MTSRRQLSTAALLAVAALLLFPACASYKLHIGKDFRDWESKPPPQKALDYRVYLIGDAGDSHGGQRTAGLQLLKQELENAPPNSAVVFLGDNIYHNGMPGPSHPERPVAEYRMRAQLDVVKNFPGKICFIAGNHDWRSGGLEGVRREEKFIEEYLGRDDVFIPENGCSGPKTENLTDKLGMIAVNSQWYVVNWDEEPQLNEDCEIRTREVFAAELLNTTREFRGKNLLVIAHHPLYSNGWHGGNYALKEHIFPLSLMHPPVKFPFPGIGTFAVWINAAISTRQEIAHPVYQEYIGAIEGAVKEHGGAIYAAGHEHNLQLEFSRDSMPHVISGSGSKSSPVRLSKRTPFVYGAGHGFAVMDFYKDGEVWVEFLRAAEDVNQVDVPGEEHLKNLEEDGDVSSSNGVAPATETRLTRQVLYRQKIKDPLPTTAELTPDAFPEYDAHPDTVAVSILEKGDIWNLKPLMWGKLWTDYYFMDLKMPVLDLAKYRGGLTAFQRGGGFQTKSVRLKVKTWQGNRFYQIRSMRKSADQLFYPLNKTFARNVLEHQFTAGNPFAAFLLPPMQSAIGVWHTNPELVYVPRQPGLNRFNAFGGEVFLLEERADEDWSDQPSFGNSKNIVSTAKTIEARQQSDDGVVDQRMVLRCRLFDMLVGDWDRHEDQWRWASQPIPGTDRTLYQPIARDRDQAFASYGGLVFHAARMLVPYFKATHRFDDHVSKNETRWLNFQSRNFDQFFLNELAWEDWEKEVRHIQKNLSDRVVEKGVSWLPDTVEATMGRRLVKGVGGRRDELMETARRYYEFLNKTVRICATHKENSVLVERLGDRQTKVTIIEWKDERTKEEKIYERTFDNRVTKEIHVYGLDGDDEFKVSGKARRRSPAVRLIGGIDEDVFLDASSVGGFGKKSSFYDDLSDENKVDVGTEGEDHRSAVSERNSYIFRENNYNYATPFPIFGYNPDDGAFFGATLNFYRFGFKKQETHTVSGTFATATTGFALDYAGEFQNIWERKDFFLEASVESPKYVSNFFGLGNDTKRDEERGRDYYRVGRQRAYLFPALKNRSAGGVFFAFGPQAEVVRIQRDSARFLTESDGLDSVRQQVFGWQYFLGGKLRFSYTNVDNPWNPDRGVRLDIEAGLLNNLRNVKRNVGSLGGSLTVYLPLGISKRFVYAMKVGGKANAGKFDFFQAATLGGDDNLRGFSSERFAGRAVFYHQNELRWKVLGRESTHLPLSFGIAPAFDYGRVWWEDDPGKLWEGKWHVGYGGSLWASPLDVVALSASAMASEEGKWRFTLEVGFGF